MLLRMMELLKTCWKKLRLFYRNIKYWFILKFDKSVFTILLSKNYFEKGDILITENKVKLEVLKIKNNTLYVRN